MQDQEAQLEEARAQINARTEPSFRASQDARFQDAQRRANEAQVELNALRTERDELARLLDDAENEHATPDHRMHLAHEQVERLKSQLANKEGQLRAADERAQDDAEAIENLRTEVEDAQRLPRQLETLRKQLADAQGDRERALDEVRSVRKQLERRDDDAALALDDATAPLQSQLRAAETEQRRLLDDAASLRRQLREEREQRASQAKDGDAQRHLAREADQLRQRLSDRDAEIAFLNSQAAERDALVSSARREAGRLRALHESPEAIGDKDAKIAELEASKNELARRLRMAETRTGADTPAAKSFAFRSVVGIPTPRTPGFYLRNARSPSLLLLAHTHSQFRCPPLTRQSTQSRPSRRCSSKSPPSKPRSNSFANNSKRQTDRSMKRSTSCIRPASIASTLLPTCRQRRGRLPILRRSWNEPSLNVVTECAFAPPVCGRALTYKTAAAAEPTMDASSRRPRGRLPVSRRSCGRCARRYGISWQSRTRRCDYRRRPRRCVRYSSFRSS